MFASAARAQFSLPDQNSTRSVSGQFIVSPAPQISALARSPRIAADTNLVRLEPTLLVVSAERIKEALWHALAIKPGTPWRGQIRFVLYSAQSPDEEVTIVSRRFAGVWNYRVELPDVLPRLKFTRALVVTLLLEYANRTAQAHSAEIPDWLTDGLSQQLLAGGSSELILSSPDKIVDGTALVAGGQESFHLPMTRLNKDTSGMDPLAGARRVLKNSPALTFEQMSWPTGAQLNGDDGGAYRASAQLFVSELLKLKNGPEKLRAMLETLPQFYNWQTAFQKSFRGNFSSPLAVEKWWALSVVSFVSLNPGPGWTLEVSRKKLDDILSVPVETRTAANSLPSHAEVSLQTAILNFDSARRNAILQTKLRNLELAQFQIAPQLAALTDGYRRALADYLGQGKARPSRTPRIKNLSTVTQKADASKTLKTLDALDARRRALETQN